MDCDEAIARGVVDIPSIEEKKSTHSYQPSEICVGVKQLSLSTLNPVAHLVSDVTAFVPKGGITAVMGASSAGKSLLMKFLCGRLSNMEWTGEVTYEGRQINPTAPENGFGFVPQEDLLIGDITVRETFTIAAGLRKNQTRSQRKQDVDAMIKTLGLAHVGDNVIGTVLKRGLSGGQKRRVMVGQELICNSACCFLDEPTSGLDGTTAFDVVDAISRFCKHSAGAFSVMLSIHQPNIRIVNLFDNILFLSGGGGVFFGTLPEAILHFTCIGKAPPAHQNPTDFIIAVTDDTFAKLNRAVQLDYCVMYSTSGLAKKVLELMDETRDRASVAGFMDAGEADDKGATADDRNFGAQETSFMQQCLTLLHRDAIVALRDPTLYYLQIILHVFYGFIIGVVFWNSPTVMDSTLMYTVGSIVWLTMLNAYMQVFKVMHLMNSNKRFEQEHSNNSYSTLAYWTAELAVTAVSHVLFIPGQAIAYFMIGLPARNFGFHVLVSYFVSLTAESMLALLTKFTTSVTYAIVASQAILVMFTAFAGGIFIPENSVPDYWRWLMEVGLFTQGSEAALLGAYRYITYACPDNYVTVAGNSGSSSPTGYICVTTSYTFDCEAYDNATNRCLADGLNVLEISTGGIDGSRWWPFWCLVILFISFRLGSLVLLQWPWVTAVQGLKKIMTDSTQHELLGLEMDVKRLQGEVTMLMSRERNNANSKAVMPITLGAQPCGGVSERGGAAACCMSPTTRITLSGGVKHVRLASSTTSLHKVAPLEEDASGDRAAETGWSSAPVGVAPLEILDDESTSNVGIEGTGHTDTETDLRLMTQRSVLAIERVARQVNDVATATPRAAAAIAGPILVWEDIVLSLPKSGKVLIDNVTGYAVGGRTLALMGPSGAGKTTLLNALSGRATYAQITGRMVLGDRPMVSTDIYYVPQFDSLNEYMSVAEVLMYMSKMKVRTDQRRQRHVMELIGILGLGQKAYMRVAALSGGEKKRVSIGLGMVSKPAVLFLDECTTGLDSAAAYSVVKYVTKVVRQTKVVCIMTIHQPSGQVFEEMEDLMLLERGRLAYFGTRERAEPFFRTVTHLNAPALSNLADVYMDLISVPPPAKDVEAGSNDPSGGGKGGQQGGPAVTSWKDLYLASEFVLALPREAKRGSVPQHTPVSAWSRYTFLLKHMLLYYWRTPAVYWLRLAELVITAFFIGTLYLQLDKTVDQLPQISGAIFFNIWCVLFAVVAATPSFTTDRMEYMQEMLNGAYGCALCCLAQFIASLPYIAFSSFVYQSIFYWTVGLGDSIEQFVYFICITALLLLTMEAIMLMIIEATKNDLIATTLSMVVLGILFLLPGFFVQTDEMVPGIRWASYFMPTRYAFNGLLFAVFHGSWYAPGVSGDVLLDQVFGQSKDEGDWQNFGILLIYVAGFRLGHYALVAHTLRPYQKKATTISTTATATTSTTTATQQ